jgi:hypothetical protein
MPLRVNILGFRCENTFDWISKLPAVQQNEIAAIRIESRMAEHFLEGADLGFLYRSFIPGGLSNLSLFPELKRVVIGMYQLGSYQSISAKTAEMRLSKAQKEIVTYMSDNFSHVKVTFEDMTME